MEARMRTKGAWILLVLCLTFAHGTQTQGASSVLPWVEDDYEGAVAEARSRDVPMFVDVWAPW